MDSNLLVYLKIKLTSPTRPFSSPKKGFLEFGLSLEIERFPSHIVNQSRIRHENTGIISLDLIPRIPASF